MRTTVRPVSGFTITSPEAVPIQSPAWVSAAMPPHGTRTARREQGTRRRLQGPARGQPSSHTAGLPTAGDVSIVPVAPTTIRGSVAMRRAEPSVPIRNSAWLSTQR